MEKAEYGKTNSKLKSLDSDGEGEIQKDRLQAL